MTKAQAERRARQEIRRRPQGRGWIIQSPHPTDPTVLYESGETDYWRACEIIRQARAEYVTYLLSRA